MFPSGDAIRNEDLSVRLLELATAIRWQYKIPTSVEVVVTEVKALEWSGQGTQAALTIDGAPFTVAEHVMRERKFVLKYAGGSRVKQLAARPLIGPVELAKVLERLR